MTATGRTATKISKPLKDATALKAANASKPAKAARTANAKEATPRKDATAKATRSPLAPAPSAPTKPAATAPAARKTKRIRGTFAIPESEYALIAKLKTTAKRTGLKLKKNEIFRLGLHALQAVPASELHDRVIALRDPEPNRRT